MSDHSWIQTYTGRRFFPLAPRVQDVAIEDIAHALSMVCRFTGHVRTFYSVAQHSVLVAGRVPGPLRLAALLHDASEAYLADVARPVKHTPAMRPYREAEARLEAVIAERFGFTLPLDPAIKTADNRMLMTEAHALMAGVHEWRDAWPFEPYTDVPIVSWAPADAEEMFLDFYHTLMRTA